MPLSSFIHSLVVVVAVLSKSNIFVDADFNYEVEKRVLERIHDLMSGPVFTCALTDKFRQNGGFPHNMDARDRDSYLTYAFTYMQEFSFDMVYYGLEDGVFLGYGRNWGTYREPANSGYRVGKNMARENEKYYDNCLNRETGERENCTMSGGSSYVQCYNNNCNKLKVCSDEISQACYYRFPPPMSATGEDEDNNDDRRRRLMNEDGSIRIEDCTEEDIKYCFQYEILDAPEVVVEEEDGDEVDITDQQLGYVPRYYNCHDTSGKFSQKEGEILKDDGTIGSCTYGDGTLVNHTTEYLFGYCNGQKCNAMEGAYRSRDYDPRYRGWYIHTKEIQRPNWSPPYPFFTSLTLGITYSHPIYTTATTHVPTTTSTAIGKKVSTTSTNNYSLLDDVNGDRKIFAGVLAIDYAFDDISTFLQNSYYHTSTVVVIYEKAEPNYIVATSTGRKVAKTVLTANETQLCPDASVDDCTVVRYKMSELDGHEMDELLVRAYEKQELENYPRDLMSVKVSDVLGSDLYVAQASQYSNGNLEWHVLVISPTSNNGKKDSLLPGDSLFGLVFIVSLLGTAICYAMLVLFFRKRKKRAVMIRDWRFTCAFINGCALSNLSALTKLGPNTDSMCLIRLWFFHLFFVCALAPLFVKVWRLRTLVGATRQRVKKISVSNKKAAFYTLPFVVIQVFLLVLYSAIDPPKQFEIITMEQGIISQRVVCASSSNVFNIVVSAFEAGLVLVGCVLAYVSRNVDEEFGEARELLFSMYNIAFIGIITALIVYVTDIDTPGKIVSETIGIFWGTVFSCAAFVLPILMAVRKENATNRSGARHPRVTGLTGSAMTDSNSKNNNSDDSSDRQQRQQQQQQQQQTQKLHNFNFHSVGAVEEIFTIEEGSFEGTSKELDEADTMQEIRALSRRHFSMNSSDNNEANATTTTTTREEKGKKASISDHELRTNITTANGELDPFNNEDVEALEAGNNTSQDNMNATGISIALQAPSSDKPSHSSKIQQDADSTINGTSSSRDQAAEPKPTEEFTDEEGEDSTISTVASTQDNDNNKDIEIEKQDTTTTTTPSTTVTRESSEEESKSVEFTDE